MRPFKYPNIGAEFVSSTGDKVVVTEQTRVYHRTGRFSWSPLVGYRFLEGQMEGQTGKASLGDFRALFKSAKGGK